MSDKPIEAAHKLAALGISVIPVNRSDKIPSADWKVFQKRIANKHEIDTLFPGKEVGIVCGSVSGGVECIDFDDPDAFQEWFTLLDDNGLGQDVYDCFIQETPSGGMHVVYRCDSPQGNQVLATEAGGRKARIETRGEGGYFKCYPSKGYKAVNTAIASLPHIDDETRDAFFSAAKYCTHQLRHVETGPPKDSPGDEFARATDWREILEPHGWTVVFQRGDATYWRRPGKSRGVSATTGHVNDHLWVFSTNVPEFDTGRAYNKFAAYTILNHNGDFKASASDLAKKGFGAPLSSTKEEKPRESVSEAPKTGILLEQFGDDFQEVRQEHLVKPYLPRGKAVLLDADGGTGKTTFTVALAAWMSVGWSMLGEFTGEPIKILYLHRHEDENRELHTVFLRNGGDPANIYYISRSAQWFPTKAGCDQLAKAIEDKGISLVVLDPLFSFLSEGPSVDLIMKNQMAVYSVLDPLMDVYSRTGAVGVHIRHTTKDKVDKKASDLGMGSAGFRNRHRGQLVMRYHPDFENYPGVVGITDEKGSLLTEKGKPFFFRKTSNLEIQRVMNITEDPWEKREVPRTGQAVDLAVEWLGEIVLTTSSVADIMEKAEAAGHSRPSIYAAKSILGLKSQKVGRHVFWNLN